MAKNKRPSPALRDFRQTSGLGVKEFASKLGISVSTLISYENGSRHFGPDFVLLAEKRVGIPRESLWPRLYTGFKRA